MSDMNRTLLATGHFTWDAIERRSDRYGSVRLSDDKDQNVLLNPSLDVLEGERGRLVAEVLIPVRSPHVGDIARGLVPSTPEIGEIVILGEGSLFIEHRGRDFHEKCELERKDEKMLQALEQAFARMAGNVRISHLSNADPQIYDLIGLRPDDGRTKDWLDPRGFYRLHLSKVNLYFER